MEVPLLLIRDGLSEHKEDKASGDRQVVRQQRKRRPLCCLCRWEDDNEEEDVLVDRDEANMKCRPCDWVLDDLAQHLCTTRRLARRCMMGHDTVRRQSPKKSAGQNFLVPWDAFDGGCRRRMKRMERLDVGHGLDRK